MNFQLFRLKHSFLSRSISFCCKYSQVGLFYDQMLGLYQGYKASLEDAEKDPVTMEDIFTMNIFGDLEDLEQAFDTEDREPAKVI